jgi:hypothetical protein
LIQTDLGEGVSHDHHSTIDGQSHRDPAVFVVRVLAVEERNREGVQEHGSCELEPDSVRGEIRSSLGPVPLEAVPWLSWHEV